MRTQTKTSQAVLHGMSGWMSQVLDQSSQTPTPRWCSRTSSSSGAATVSQAASSSRASALVVVVVGATLERRQTRCGAPTQARTRAHAASSHPR